MTSVNNLRECLERIKMEKNIIKKGFHYNVMTVLYYNNENIDSNNVFKTYEDAIEFINNTNWDIVGYYLKECNKHLKP